MNNTGTIRLPHFDSDNFHKITLKNIEFSIYILAYMRLTITKITDDINWIAVDHNKATNAMNEYFQIDLDVHSYTLFFILCQTFFQRISFKKKKREENGQERRIKNKEEKEIAKKR